MPWWRSTAMHREMAYVGGMLYLGGGVLVLLTVVLPSWDLHDQNIVVGVGVAASAVGLFYLWSADRLPMPLWMYSVATTTGAVLVTLAAYGGGPSTTATYGVLYVFVATYGFYYYPWPIASWLIAVNGVGFAIVLARHDVDTPFTQWLMIEGAALIAGGLIGTLGRRTRSLVDLERENVRILNDVDEWKTTFLRAAAHDLRSPLAALIGSLKTVDAHADRLTDDQRRALIGQSLRATERLERLVTDLLDMERIEAGDFQPRLEDVSLDVLVAAAVAEIDPKGHTIEIDAEPVVASVEPSKVERIVDNLVSNAVRHTPRGVTVQVRVTRDGDHAVISVIDDGPGIDPESAESLFNAFRSGGGTTEPGAAVGLGLGLNLVRQFTRLHAGEVAVSNVPGGGARFDVRLPLRPS